MLNIFFFPVTLYNKIAFRFSIKSNDAYLSLQWRQNERDSVSNHRRLDCLLIRSFRRRSKKISKLRVTGLCEGNPQLIDAFPSQRASNVENVPIWWGLHVFKFCHSLHLSIEPCVNGIITWEKCQVQQFNRCRFLCHSKCNHNISTLNSCHTWI